MSVEKQVIFLAEVFNVIEVMRCQGRTTVLLLLLEVIVYREKYKMADCHRKKLLLLLYHV